MSDQLYGIRRCLRARVGCWASYRGAADHHQSHQTARTTGRERVDCQPKKVDLELPGLAVSRLPLCSGSDSRVCGLDRESSRSRRFGVSGTGRFLCNLKTTAQLGWGPDGARMVVGQGTLAGGRLWMTANRRVVRNASKPPWSPHSPCKGTDCHLGSKTGLSPQ